MKSKLTIFLLVTSISLFSFYLVKTSAAQSNETANSSVNELMEQGKIRTCLAAKILLEDEEPGEGEKIKKYIERKIPVHLTGTCGSPTGCTCTMSWGLNNAVANRDEFENASGNREKIEAELTLKEKVKKLKKGKCKSKNGQIDCSGWARDRAVHINHGKADLRNPVLANLKPGTSACHIIKNNLQAKNTSKNSQVLGENTSYLAPGPVDVVVEETTYRHTPFDFAAVGELSSNTTSTELGQGGANGEDNTQKQGVLKFFMEKLDAENLETNCVSVSWDPYGRVFDAVSLEPISDVYITLIDAATGQPATQEFNFNDDVTGEDGLFNIQVEKEGSYQMTVEPLTDHKFISNSNLSQYWSKIYSNLYKPGETFLEKTGIATHHDIALQPQGEPYRGAIAAVLPETIKSQNLGDYIVYSGRETFPMAKVCLFDEETRKSIGKCVNANNIGKFTIALEKSVVPPKKILVTAEKVNLNDQNFYKNDQKIETLQVNYSPTDEEMEQKKAYFEPILSYIEGYVYGEDGKSIPNASVLVKLSTNDQLFYQTKADDSGFFTIYTNNLPYVEYYLEFIDPKTGEKIKKTTSQFVSDNRSYLESEKINLLAGTKYNQPIINPQTGELNKIDKNYQTNKTSSKTFGQQSLGKGIVFIMVILLILFISLIGVVLYIRKIKYHY